MNEKILDTFRKLDFTLKHFEKDIYVFTYQGVNLVYKHYVDDDSFLQIGLPLHKCDNVHDIYRLANELNLRLKYVKACVYKGNLWVLYEQEISEETDFESLINNIVICMINSLHFYMDLTRCNMHQPKVEN